MNISQFIRKTGLIKFADTLRFYYFYCKTYTLRRDFRRQYPGIVLPPPFYMYETFGLNCFQFYADSIETASWLASYFRKYKNGTGLKILDWGCGPGRVVRHLPGFFDKSCEFYGTDYNKKYVKWCSENIAEAKFANNDLQPPLPYAPATFDIIYGISIFTHLSEEMHYQWFEELMRVLKPGGILFITLHGNAFKNKLTDSERIKFEKGELVVKSKTKEGHRTFAAFQPDSFVKSLAGNHPIREHAAGDAQSEKPQQDIWIFQKSDG